MSKLIILVGLPGSGKSEQAKFLAEHYDAQVFSSDDIREELLNDVNNQDKNVEVFEEMNKRTQLALNQGKTVVYDATNINRKRRKHLINHVFKADGKVAYYLNADFETVLNQNQQRDRAVPLDVIEKMYKTLEIPVEGEGFDKVYYINNFPDDRSDITEYVERVIQADFKHDSLFSTLSLIKEFDSIVNLPQDSSYHSFSVSRHTYYVYDYIRSNYDGEDKLMMLYVSLFHDIGKGFCKSFRNFKGEETRYANFIGHEYVSSQIAASVLPAMGYSESFVKDVATLIQFHMMPMKASEKKMKEVHSLIGDNLYEKLMFLHEADLQAK